MTNWKYTNARNEVVFRELPDGRMESCLATREDVVAWVAAGNTIQAADTVLNEAQS